MKKATFIITAMLILVGCSKNDDIVNSIWQDAESLRQQEELGAAIGKLAEIIKDYPKNKKAAEAQFMIGEIYLNDVKNYSIALDEFNKVIREFPESDMAEKALFMVGYINTNYLQAFSDGIDNYRLFLDKYPKSELVAAVRYELDSLKNVEKQISELTNMEVSDSEVPKND